MQVGLRYNTVAIAIKHTSFLARQSSVRHFAAPVAFATKEKSTVVGTYTNPGVAHYSIKPPVDEEEETKLHKKGKEDTRYVMAVASDTIHNVEEFVVDTAKSAYSSTKEYSKVVSDELKKEHDPDEKDFVHKATEAVTVVATDVYTATRKVAKKAGDALYDKGTDLAAAGTYKIIQGVSTLAHAGKEYAAGAVDAVKESLPDKEQVEEAAHDAFQSTKEFAMGASEKIVHGVGAVAHAGYETGKDFVAGATEVAAKSASETVAAAQEYANKKIVDDKKPEMTEKKSA